MFELVRARVGAKASKRNKLLPILCQFSIDGLDAEDGLAEVRGVREYHFLAKIIGTPGRAEFMVVMVPAVGVGGNMVKVEVRDTNMPCRTSNVMFKRLLQACSADGMSWHRVENVKVS